MSFPRIELNAQGIPFIRNTRVPITSIVEMAAKSLTVEGIQAKYPELKAEDIYEALAFATVSLLEHTNSED